MHLATPKAHRSCLQEKAAVFRGNMQNTDGLAIVGNETCFLKVLSKPLFLLAGDPGFEPGLTESESAVLPLDESPSGKPEKPLWFILLAICPVKCFPRFAKCFPIVIKTEGERRLAHARMNRIIGNYIMYFRF
jgi:hypothetical protein